MCNNPPTHWKLLLRPKLMNVLKDWLLKHPLYSVSEFFGLDFVAFSDCYVWSILAGWLAKHAILDFNCMPFLNFNGLITSVHVCMIKLSYNLQAEIYLLAWTIYILDVARIITAHLRSCISALEMLAIGLTTFIMCIKFQLSPFAKLTVLDEASCTYVF